MKVFTAGYSLRYNVALTLGGKSDDERKVSILLQMGRGEVWVKKDTIRRALSQEEETTEKTERQKTKEMTRVGW